MNRFFDVAGDVCTQLAPWVTATLTWDGRPVRRGQPLYRLEQSLRFQSDRAQGVLVVPAGFISDLASIPREAWTLFMTPDDPRIALGAWVHDLLYQNEGAVILESGAAVALTREEADQVLAFEAMPDLGATRLESQLVYQALRCFGARWSSEPPAVVVEPFPGREPGG